MQVALTGGASGIGASVAQKLMAAGHEVTAFDLAEPETPVTRWIRTDLADAGSIAQAAQQAEGPFDALINNAGLPPRDRLTEKILAVNYIGLHAFQQALLDRLPPGAAIVNTASRAGAAWRDNLDQVKALMALEADDLPGFVTAQGIDPTRAYNLSKEALIVSTMAQTRALQDRGIRINSVSPAAVSTGILDDFATAFGDRMVQNVARVGRPGTAEEIADVIVFLASPASRWINGQDIVVDGGMSAMITQDALAL